MITDHEILDLLEDAVQSDNGLRLAVTGRSMGPAFVSATDIQIVQCESSSIPLSRLVVFQRDGRWVAHRVMWKTRGPDGVKYLTKGDGLAQLDSPSIQASGIKGMVSRWWSDSGATVDLLSRRSRVHGWLIVMRFWIGWFILRNGRGPRRGHPV